MTKNAQAPWPTMASSTDDIMAHCASCGNGGDSLKKCTACKLVKYCSIDCQGAHRPKHEKACKRRVAELHDEALFQQPPSREECPICFLTLPLEETRQIYRTCCGKILCYGCMYASAVTQSEAEDAPCPFCREPVSFSDEDDVKRLNRLMEFNDPAAIFIMAQNYFLGDLGFQQDFNKALALFQKAAEYGSIDAHEKLGKMYRHGEGVQVDRKKAKHHLEIAAMAGHAWARYNLGSMESQEGNTHRAMKHFRIAASAGVNSSLKPLQDGYKVGWVTKDDFEKALRAHKKAQDEMKSEWRNKASANQGALLDYIRPPGFTRRMGTP